MNKITRLLGFAGLCALFLAVSFFAGYYVRALAVEYPALRWPLPGIPIGDAYPLLQEVRSLLEARYIQPLPDDKTLEYGAVRGLVSAVGDPYTVFVEPQTHELETQSLQGEYGGVGMNLSKSETGEIVLSPFPDSPAAKAGIVEGDVLLAVDETPIGAATTLDEASALVRGLVGAKVILVVRHNDGQELTVTIERQRIQIPSVTWKMVEADVGLIAISRFSDRTDDEVKGAATELQALGAARYVLDLRDNGGGILDAAVDVAAQFLDGGVVMYETQREAPEKAYDVPANNSPLATAPLVVLVNHGTASAAEIVAGALLDRERAPLIGQTTYGKGSVQLVYDLSDGSSLHVTAYLWYTPSRRALDKNGLPPTVVIEPAADGTDAQLARAIEHLNSIGLH